MPEITLPAGWPPMMGLPVQGRTSFGERGHGLDFRNMLFDVHIKPGSCALNEPGDGLGSKGNLTCWAVVIMPSAGAKAESASSRTRVERTKKSLRLKEYRHGE